ncbi:MAG: hypothetical protein JEY96_18310 [Bacteroidales bacterium]|nr:hypothetical protein [Bacteroidales bacterium]
MESLLQVILILSVIKFACKATFYKSYSGILIFAGLAGIFAYLIHPFVIRQNGDFYSVILSKSNRVTDIAVLITIEAISGILISVAMLQNLFIPKKRIWVRILKLTPGVLIAGAIFYFELKAFYFSPGLNFKLTALITSLSLFVAIFLISVYIKKNLRTEGSRYEFKFLLNAFLLIIAIILNAGLASYNRSSYNIESGFEKLASFIFIAVTISALGYFLNKIKQKKQYKFLQKWI